MGRPVTKQPLARVRTPGSSAVDSRGSADRAIGVFDSGVGGLTVLKALSVRMPRETLLYLGDTARVPYGSKSADTVTGYAVETGDFFAERDVKLMVVACNTTSAIALDILRARYPVPVLGVIEPGARAAIKATRRGRIGVIGTEATIASGAYARALRDLEPDVEIFTRACPLFVPLAEEGWTDNEVARRTVSLYLSSLKRSGIDTLILGCTHYPLLRSAIESCMGPGVRAERVSSSPTPPSVSRASANAFTARASPRRCGSCCDRRACRRAAAASPDRGRSRAAGCPGLLRSPPPSYKPRS